MYSPKKVFSPRRLLTYSGAVLSGLMFSVALELSVVASAAAADANGPGAPVIATTRRLVPDAAMQMRPTPTPARASLVVAPQAVESAPLEPGQTPDQGLAARNLAAHMAAARLAAKGFSGKDHLWIPSLGISDPVGPYPCGRTGALANEVYLWGCAGANNAYFLGHAYGVFKILHDAWLAGGLGPDTTVIYADTSGTAVAYSLREIRTVKPTDSAWALAAQEDPSVTIQTCVGDAGDHRVLFRFALAGEDPWATPASGPRP